MVQNLVFVISVKKATISSIRIKSTVHLLSRGNLNVCMNLPELAYRKWMIWFAIRLYASLQLD